MPTRALRLVKLVILAAALSGCASRLATHPPMEPGEAWRLIAARASSIAAVSATADVTMTGRPGTSLRVDAALVMSPPDLARLRAWKLGHAVLDVTCADGVVWVDAPGAPGERGADGLGVPPDELARGLLMIPAWSLADARPIRAERRSDRYYFEFPSPEGPVACEALVRSLVVVRWCATREGAIASTLDLGDYRLVGGVPWAHRAVLRAGDQSIRLDLRDVALDEPADPGAFNPPAGARRMP